VLWKEVELNLATLDDVPIQLPAVVSSTQSGFILLSAALLSGSFPKKKTVNYIAYQPPSNFPCRDGKIKIWSVNELRQGTNSILLDDDDDPCCPASMTLSSDQALR